MINTKRQPQGIPSGGQWVSTMHSEGEVELSEPDQPHAYPLSDFEDHLTALRAYAEMHGTTYMPGATTAGDIKLGRWVDTRRRRRGSNRALDAALEDIPGWQWETRTKSGDPVVDYAEHIENLDAFIEQFGHAAVPHDYATPSGMRLGTWVIDRRANQGQYPTLDAVLEKKAGWKWAGEAPRRSDGPSYKALLDHIKAGGNARVPTTHVTAEGVRLGKWVADQRPRRGIDPSFDAKLESLPGWTWAPRVDARQSRMAELRDYISANGNAQVPRSFVTDTGAGLGDWVNGRRAVRGEDPAFDAELEALPGWTWGKRGGAAAPELD